MHISTYTQLDFPQWPEALELYHQAFPKWGRKPDMIIQKMFAEQICCVHTADSDDFGLTAMAITGIVKKANLLLIDYLAVREDLRGQGIGKSFINGIKKWAGERMKLDGVLVEVESERTTDHLRRIRFWEHCGFTLTEYVHHYIWVPEPYQAMYASLGINPAFPTDGETLFRYITEFHRKSFRSR